MKIFKSCIKWEKAIFLKGLGTYMLYGFMGIWVWHPLTSFWKYAITKQN